METIILQFKETSMIEWLGTIAGLVGVSLSIKEKILAWPLFIICYCVYIILSFRADLYAAMVLNACFIPISIYGWIQWKNLKDDSKSSINEKSTIQSLSPKNLTGIILIAVLGTLILGFTLSSFVKSALPYLDAFATTLSFIAQWMLGKKILQNWIFWIVADLCFIILWGFQGYYATVIMFVVFIFLATKGFLSWNKELKNSNLSCAK